MSEETKRQFIETWMQSLAASARDLDLSAAEDRATFRGLVQHSMRNLTWDGMRRIAQHLGADKVGRSRDAAWRALTTLYIQRRQAASHATKKKPSQLDAEIAESLRHKERRANLTPVEGLRIPAESRRTLKRFWNAHPDLRQGCVDKYGFDPIDEEAAYWRYGLAEPDHADLLRTVRRNNNIFSLSHVTRWAAEEKKSA